MVDQNWPRKANRQQTNGSSGILSLCSVNLESMSATQETAERSFVSSVLNEMGCWNVPIRIARWSISTSSNAEGKPTLSCTSIYPSQGRSGTYSM